MPARRGRPRKGDRRIDAAIDHFTVMGYAARDVKAVVTDLLKVYGGPDAWPLLEEGGSYQVVQERLFEIEEKEKEKKDQQLLLEYHQQQDGQQVEDELPQHQEPAADEEAEDPMFIEPQDTISISNEAPAETKSADKEVEDPMFIEPPAREAALALNAARTGPRRPCYGWLSESEDEEEEQPTCQKHEVHVPSPGEQAQ
ncbi:hypothetical protein BDA96_02G248200 [Sorghum bicolor]|uniref:WIYLD domain-containing protein n=2 Tax=Sorghum bicolor TaxID=4558 RepID=A0A921RQR8_SORBI|nr:uncharacterized protein LOC8083282 [Sorghum bicolor]EER96920.1 hypothetical protein SORBI_3002G237200 [Sorghum bicolor]KAG0544128.1 hypothetical protein BDA96_02G248200 [Sorghum bicolor]|eukprot:XP_002460399.1 uncharacterized protein LOC8083282 [Sorghum bicolor]